MLRILIVCLILAFASGCTTVKTAVESADLEVYRQHAESLASIDNWQILGKISVRTESRGEIGRMLWIRDGESHQMELYGNFGSRRIRIVQDASGVVLEDTQGRKILGSSIEAVLELRTGQSLPVAELIYWITGASYPRVSSVNVWDVEGRLVSLQQSGWTIKFSKYREYGKYVLPTRLKMVADESETLPESSETSDRIHEIRIAISDWGIE